jgi:glycosyltransferase involved in cell wall biosynthesis
MVGIGITTYKRKDLLEKCLENFQKYSTHPYKLYIAQDTDANRKGIALRKNECLENLKHCDYIFLFDDDCYPIQSGWEDFFIKAHKASGYHHFCYLTKNLHIEKNYYFCGDYTIKSYAQCGGVFMFITKEVLNKVGGFYNGYKFYGFEHLGYTLRIFFAKLIPEMYLSVDGAENYLFAHDYQEENFQSTMDKETKLALSEENKYILETDAKEIYRPIITERYESK